MGQSMLTPVLMLVTWSLIIWVLLYVRRIPAAQAANIHPDSAKHPGSLDILPSRVRAAADNYNHLHEQPTVFYALAFYSHLVGVADPLNVGLAWAYVGLRVLHSLVQVTVNKVMVRLAVFALSSLALMAMAARNLLALG